MKPYLGFEVLTAVNVKIMVVCNVTQYCSRERHNFSEELSASIFREMEVGSLSESLVPIYKITRRHILEYRIEKSIVLLCSCNCSCYSDVGSSIGQAVGVFYKCIIDEW
jgi:hypothetical protein